MKRDLFRTKLLAHLESMDKHWKQIANDVNLLLRRYQSDEPLAWERKKLKK